FAVCPTTLKRICRQHGITRWPSRKIKKVGHSLRKLQLVIDSVHPGGQLQIGSFYDNFPELGSPDAPKDQLTNPPAVPTLTTNSKSPPSSSCSQSSTSSFSCSAETKQTTTTATTSLVINNNTSGGLLKRARSDAELLNAGGDEMETKFLLRCHSQKLLRELPSQGGTPTMTVFKVKATFREVKIRFSMHQNWGFMDLQREIARRFNLEDVSVKYLDDDSEWVLLTCDEDLEECVDIHKCSKNRTIKLSVQEGFNPNNGSSFGGISSL
ncbi:protein NLP2-like, partial [Impatiens glandulifera]|uniref:protein NLP2-like n=1 Tax=Impatiens glandulifera TaxID=253017 RepID=UPI001FB0DFF9